MVYTFIVSAFGLAFFLWYFATYNLLVNYRSVVDQCWAQIEVELKRRFDLIGSLVEVVKGYASHEATTLRDVVASRRDLLPLTSAVEGNVANSEMRKGLHSIIAVVEGYPSLLADRRFASLQAELTETENRIAERRQRYNNAVNRFANALDSFPSRIIGFMHKFKRREFFDAEPEADQAPRIIL